MYPNLIILEGCDCCGKTTFAKALQGYEYIHFGPPTDRNYTRYMAFLNELDPTKKYVVDRFHWGDMVYGPLKRGKSDLTEEEFRNIEMKLLKLDHIVIFFHNTYEFISKKFDERGETYINKDEIPEILRRFTNVFTNSILRKDEFVIGKKDLIDFTQTGSFRFSSLLNAFESVGSVSAKYMFVGDQINLNSADSDYPSAFDFGPSSRYFYNMIKELGISLRDIYVTNAHKTFGIEGDLPDLAREIIAVNPSQLIVMGKRAQATINALTLIDQFIKTPPIFIPHPSYLQRFPEEVTKFNIKNLRAKIRQF